MFLARERRMQEHKKPIGRKTNNRNLSISQTEKSNTKNPGESVRFFHDLEEISFDLVWKMDENFNFTYASPCLEKTLGYSSGEMLGKALRDFQTSSSSETDLHLLEKLKKNEILGEHETQLLDKKGDAVYLTINAKHVTDIDGQKAGFLVSAKDTSRLRQIEQAYIEDEEEYKAYIEITDTGYVKLDENGKVKNANMNYVRMSGHSTLEEIVGKNVSGWTASYDRERNENEVRKCLSEGSVRDLRIDYVHDDGTVVPIEINATVRESKTGRIIVTLCRDITSRKAIEKSLQESNIFIKNLIDTANIVIVGLRNDGSITVFNRYAEDLTGYKKEEVEGKNWFDIFIPKKESTGTKEEFDRVIEGSLPNRFENPILTKTGEERIIEWSNSRVYEAEKLTGVISFGIDVTGLKLGSEALMQSEERFRRIYEEGQFGITIAGPDFKFIGANPAFCRMIGYSEEELSDLTFANISHPDSRGVDIDKVMAIKRGELRQYKTEKKYVKKNKEILWGSLITSAIRGKNDEVLYYLAMVVDVTEKKRAEETLRESEEKYRSIIEQNSEGVVVMNKQGEIIEWNRAIEEISGIPRTLAIGRPFFEIQAKMISPDKLTPEHVDYLRNTISGALDSEDNPVFKKPIEAVFKRGMEKIYILQTAFPIRMGNDYRIGLIIRNITDRKQAEIAIAAEKERLAITLRSIGDGVITSDIAGSVMMMNRVAEQLTGWKQEEAVGLPLSLVYNIIDEVTRKKCDNPVERVLSSGLTAGFSSQVLLVSRDGFERIIADSGAPIKDNRGITIGIVLVFRDMTEKQKLLDASQKSQKIESLGILAGGIAHDFNNLLGGIYGNIEMIRSVSFDPRIVSYIDATMSTLNRARNLTQQLLTFAKGGSPVRKIGALFPFIRETVEFSLSGSSVSSEYRVQDDLWLCEYDANQIGQVIDNLIINAVQAMPLGGVISINATNVYFRADEKPSLEPGRYIRISVTDSGVGIPKDIRSRIFDPFFTTKQKGSGLGLATSYSIMKRHGGVIEIESEYGPGTTFNLFFPASTRTEVEKREISEIARKGSGKILVMDDEEVLRRTMRVMLESLGYEAMTAKDGEDAVRIIEEQSQALKPFTAAILDLTIHGGMGGKETVAEIRKIDSAVPLIVSSGYADDPIMSRPFDYGFAGSLRKPFTVAELSQLLRFVTCGK
jgi:PAS domain S-box-containing protein